MQVTPHTNSESEGIVHELRDCVLQDLVAMGLLLRSAAAGRLGGELAHELVRVLDMDVDRVRATVVRLEAMQARP